MKRSRSRIPVVASMLAFCVLALMPACGGGGGTPSPPPAPATPAPTPEPTPAETQEVRITWRQTIQRISGFGGSSAWHSTPPTDHQADLLFSPQNGIGLAFLRVRIAPDGTTVELPTIRVAQARGAQVWAAPWSPPGAWKTNGSASNGGRLLPEFYQAWADRLADFVVTMQGEGVELTHLSVQNEPGWVAEWETCEWTPTELLTFVRDHLGPALDARGLSVPLLAPESNDWHRLRGFADPMLADPATSSRLGVIAVHAYGGSPFDYPAPAESGKEFWQTEWSTPAVGAGMDSGLQVASSIHDHLATASMNSWHYWWITDATQGTAGGLIQAGVVTKRLWVMGNYSRFVRPGSLRVASRLTDPVTAPGLLVSAYRNDDDGTLIAVAVNTGAAVQPLLGVLEDVEVDAITPWVTSESLDLVAQETLPGGATFTYELPPLSVTSFVATIR